MNEVKQVITILIRAKSAESGPPLGTVLGNIGVNAIKFAKEFNEYTEDLPNFLKVKVKISIFRNNSFTFTVDLPTIGKILSLLKKEDDYLDLLDIIKVALIKLPEIPLEKSVLIVLGTVQNMNLRIKIISTI